MPQNKTSTTAYGIVCGLSKLAALSRWRPYFSEEMLQLNAVFLKYGADTAFKQFMRWLPPETYLKLLDCFFVPGMNHHFLFRKIWLEKRMSQLVENGARQVIVLGAGFDTLMLRMAGGHPNVQFFEIDLPGTQARKQQALKASGVVPAKNCNFAPADLAKDKLEEVLTRQPGFDASLPTVLIMEGVLMYLMEAEVASLLATIRRLFGKEITLLFGATAQSDDQAGYRMRLFNGLFLKHETANKWYCPSELMPTFVATLGYKVDRMITYKTLQERYRQEDELVKLPEEDENYYQISVVA